MSKILHRFTGTPLRKAVAGHGIYITDSQGKSYIDASGGAAVSCLGHGHVDGLDAMRAQMNRIAYAHTSFFTTEIAESLAESVTALAPEGLNHTYLVSGGSEAVEAALKMARQYFVEVGQPRRRHIIARRQSYHGNTIGAPAVGGNAWRRAQFQPILRQTYHVSPCRIHARIKREAMALGLLCYPMGGTIDEIHGDPVLLAPPYIVSPEEIDVIVDRLAPAIEAALRR
ncbi:adenosylmethionine-8-amino-7-oxononanoate aminotransferase [Bradyrhizobium sp. LM3.4]